MTVCVCDSSQSVSQYSFADLIIHYSRKNMSSFNLDINFNSEGWGPKIGEHVAAFEDVPYAHFDKKDRLFRQADNFNLQNQTNAKQYQRSRYHRGSDDVNAEFSYKHDNSEDSTFKLVDTAKSQQNKSKFTAGMKSSHASIHKYC